MLKRLTLILGFASALLLSACNTMEGMGEDIQRGGEKLEDKAEQERAD